MLKLLMRGDPRIQGLKAAMSRSYIYTEQFHDQGLTCLVLYGRMILPWINSLGRNIEGTTLYATHFRSINLVKLQYNCNASLGGNESSILQWLSCLIAISDY